MGFITALMIMLGSAFLYEKVQTRSVEVAVGCMAVALVSLVVAIVVAPWQIQLLMLLGILLSSAWIRVDLFS
ncbi:hypothetical protein [Leptolyngbya sp. 7M]|uniref:Uncharacterized protein n=1 Tax=Leptolyngbya sp. NK1-12 TaxID=2547451 RepID=A0AA96WCV9_9CYAN|nr:hypothetical protein [Leptolyngbya sp. 7M]MBF2050999.1 hypothetical protein [Elainella sp. C42_A2020_010]QYO64346.1 hypothetical protein JVX88_32380 [Leptolyngbya sp. 7M]RNJ66844.1 MAG: hypothetical protein EDM05_23550 [Leptolyngbya sp. IPPAS B-1204]WNZ22794.1 hypothetical protein HJG54_07950 [Leptolyngbya sp. NK1-12]